MGHDTTFFGIATGGIVAALVDGIGLSWTPPESDVSVTPGVVARPDGATATLSGRF